MILKKISIPALCLVLIGCNNTQSFEDKLSKTLKEKPELITNIIEENPHQFISAFQKAAKSAQDKMAEKRRLDEAKKIENNFKNPLKPKIRPDEAVRGNKNAPLVLVEYTDFECPFCGRGTKTVNSLRQKYGDKIKVIYKHLPLSFHKNAMITAKYYEALRLQKNSLAFEFHDEVFKKQSRLKEGERFLEEISSKLGADIEKLKRDVHSPIVKERIEQDRLEAQKFGIQGTPGFLLNGVLVRGAYPKEHFVQIIDELQKRKLVKL